MSSTRPGHARDPHGSSAPTDRPRGDAVRLIQVPETRTREVVEVLTQAFRWYPVMEHVAGGDPGSEARERIRLLVRFFVLARVTSGHPILGLEDDRGLVAVATLTPPGHGSPPSDLEEIRAETWSRLGADARARYEELGRMWGTFEFPEPHHHLNMIGVLPERTGQGLGRRLLAAVHDLVAGHASSAGVSLTTETPRNVELYERAGYDVVARGTVRTPDGTPAVRTWGMFRPV